MKTLSVKVWMPLALASVLASGCTKTAPNSSANNEANPPQATNQNQPSQQAMNPGATPTPQSSTAPQGAAPQAAPATAPSTTAQTAAPSRAPAATQAYAPAPRPVPPPEPTVIPAGTHLVVTLAQEISTKTAQAGQPFNATIAVPVVVHGRTLVRAGAPASGEVVDAKSLGHFAGQAVLALRLDAIRVGGRTYDVRSSTFERAEKGKGKRTAAFIGGGTGLGALIGGLAGGGKGAAIGALSGAGAGTAGSAFTGNKQIVIPAESRLTFRVERDVRLQ